VLTDEVMNALQYDAKKIHFILGCLESINKKLTTLQEDLKPMTFVDHLKLMNKNMKAFEEDLDAVKAKLAELERGSLEEGWL
jgi:hypothetical protein